MSEPTTNVSLQYERVGVSHEMTLSVSLREAMGEDLLALEVSDPRPIDRLYERLLETARQTLGTPELMDGLPR